MDGWPQKFPFQIDAALPVPCLISPVTSPYPGGAINTHYKTTRGLLLAHCSIARVITVASGPMPDALGGFGSAKQAGQSALLANNRFPPDWMGLCINAAHALEPLVAFLEVLCDAWPSC